MSIIGGLVLSKSNCDFLGYGVAFLDHVVLFVLKLVVCRRSKRLFKISATHFLNQGDFL